MCWCSPVIRDHLGGPGRVSGRVFCSHRERVVTGLQLDRRHHPSGAKDRARKRCASVAASVVCPAHPVQTHVVRGGATNADHSCRTHVGLRADGQHRGDLVTRSPAHSLGLVEFSAAERRLALLKRSRAVSAPAAACQGQAGERLRDHHRGLVQLKHDSQLSWFRSSSSHLREAQVRGGQPCLRRGRMQRRRSRTGALERLRPLVLPDKVWNPWCTQNRFCDSESTLPPLVSRNGTHARNTPSGATEDGQTRRSLQGSQ